MEELADNYLAGVLAEYKGVRFSEASREDIKALALNRLWPMYTTSDAGRTFLKKVIVEDRIEKDIVRELKLAIDKVRQNPRG
jgi:hypothetical protein